MGNVFNKDFRDFLEALNNNDVSYILVGGFSVILHGHSRVTGDMDIWVEKTEDNYKKILIAFHQFGLAIFDMTKENFLHHESWDVFRFGKNPTAIDIMTKVKGLEFKKCYTNSSIVDVERIKVRLINYNDLIKAKKASSRNKDLGDIDALENNKN